MRTNVARRALSGVVTIIFLAGCSSGSSSLAPGAGSPSSSQSVTRHGPMRILPGPAVAGPILVPLDARPTVRSPHSTKPRTLFVSDIQNNQVLMYDPTVVNPSPEGSITSGISSPAGLATDLAENLYVANLGNSTITVYPAGSTSPSLTISNGVAGPYGIAVDGNNNVFVANLNNNTVTGYQAGATTPFETIGFPSGSQAIGLAVDINNNLYVSSDSSNQVFEVPSGSSTPQDLGLTGLAGPIGIAFRNQGTLYVSNFAANSVSVFKAGSQSASFTFNTGLNGPTLSGFSRHSVFFQANQNNSTVQGYEKNQSSPFSTISGIVQPLGVTSTPKQHP